MKKYIFVISIIILFACNIGCQQLKHQPNYQAAIMSRSQRDTTLSYKEIYLDEPITKYDSEDKIIIDLFDDYISIPDIETAHGIVQINDNIPAHIYIEQHCNSRKVDLIAIRFEGNEYTLKSLVEQYMDFYGIYSYFETIYHIPNPQFKRYTPDNKMYDHEMIMSEAMYAMPNVSITRFGLHFVWEWKNVSIIISSSDTNKIEIIFSKRT